MMSSDTLRSKGYLGPEYNEFLFALIGPDQFGRPLSVVSALARLDLDAWAEAASLARLPRSTASEKLSASIRKFTDCPQIVKDSNKIAARLVALLPRSRALVEAPANARRGLWGEHKRRRQAALMGLIMLALIAVQILAWQTRMPATPHNSVTTNVVIK